MVNQLNKDINDKLDEIINEIETSPIYQKYLLLKEKISNDKELMNLINRVRVMQKDVLHHKKSKEDLNILLDELNSNPLYIEYSNTIYEINNNYGIIETSINNYFDKLLN